MKKPTLKSGLAAVALLAASTACSSTHYPVQYVPNPLEAPVEVMEDQNASARALASILGLRREGDTGPGGAEVRLRIENLGYGPLELDLDSLLLMSADLQEFGRPAIRVHGADDASANRRPSAGPGETIVVDLDFPFPETMDGGGMDVRTLNLRFTVDFAGRPVTTGANFEQLLAESRPSSFFSNFSLGVGYTAGGTEVAPTRAVARLTTD